MTSNIEAPRDTTEEFPLAGVCGKPYIKSRGRPVGFPRASRWESSNSFPALRCRDKRCGHHPSCAFAEERQASLSPCPPVLPSSSSSSQKPLQTLLPDWTRPVPGFRWLVSEVHPIASLSSWPSHFIISQEKANKSRVWAEDFEYLALAKQCHFPCTLPHASLLSGQLCKVKGMDRDRTLGRMGVGLSSVLLGGINGK